MQWNRSWRGAFQLQSEYFFAEYKQPLLLLDEPALTIAVDHAGATHHGAGVGAGRLLCGAGVAGGCFVGVVVAGVFVLATRSLSQFLRRFETTPRLLGAETDVVVDADDAGAARHGAGVCWLRALFAGSMGGG